MNIKDRKQLSNAIKLLEDAQSIIEGIKDGEQEKYDNLSEGLQMSEKGQKFEDIVSVLEDSINSIDEAIGSVQEAME